MTEFQWVAAVLVATFSVARVARLLIFDDFPPVHWLRKRWFVLTGDGPWSKLMECPFCLAPYLAAVCMVWFHFSDGHWTWWVANGWWALSYLAAIVVSYDQPEG